MDTKQSYYSITIIVMHIYINTLKDSKQSVKRVTTKVSFMF